MVYNRKIARQEYRNEIRTVRERRGIKMEQQGKTRSEQIAEDLMGRIRRGDYTEGERLPTEKELCALLGAGRNTVREALKLLASRNVVVIRQGAGTYLSDKLGVSDDPFGFALVSDRKKLTKDLLQVRVILEPPIAALAAQCAGEQEIQELEGILKEMESVMEKKGDYSELDVKFHTKIAECTGNSVMEHLIPVIGKGVAVFAKEVPETEYEQTMLSHRRIFACIRERRPFEAQEEMRFHLLYNNNRYLNGAV